MLKIPDHAAENDQLTSNPNLRCPGWQYIAMPLNPAKVINKPRYFNCFI